MNSRTLVIKGLILSLIATIFLYLGVQGRCLGKSKLGKERVIKRLLLNRKEIAIQY
jgi:hypothetical protein